MAKPHTSPCLEGKVLPAQLQPKAMVVRKLDLIDLVDLGSLGMWTVEGRASAATTNFDREFRELQ